ncbi:MAG: acetyl-CoA C-acyltransferase family protein [Myxococcota bacterium]
MHDVVIVSGARTAIGTFGGSLAQTPPVDLATTVIQAALERGDVDPKAVGHVVVGNVIHTETRDMYVSRVGALQAGVDRSTPCLTVNRLCGSGLQAIVSAAQHIMLGDADVAVGGGAENMSRSPHSSQSLRRGHKMGNVEFEDMMLGALHDPFGHGHMGITAENIAAEKGITREAQDAVALESQRRAARAIEEGRFKEQIVPVMVRVKREERPFVVDEHVRTDATPEGLAKLRPVFKKDGSVTAGNASGINDGAAAIVMMSAERAEREGRKPMAKILGYAHAGVDPRVMGLGPIPAVQKLFEKTGIGADQLDVVESNEAFASQCKAVEDALGLDPAKTNPNGGAIALGHPIGGTGAILTVKAMYELDRIDGRYGLITMCIGGGQGIAMLIERPS